MLTEISQSSLKMVHLKLQPTDDDDRLPGWSSDPWFQRDQVWGLDRKQKLIDSIRQGMPFGMICLWHHRVNGSDVKEIIDGKQRCTTICAFMNNKFRDIDGKFWKEWSDKERSDAKNEQVAVQVVTLEEHETDEKIYELFRRINTQSKQLTAGQLLKSSESVDMMKFVNTVFFDDISDGGLYAENIAILRKSWATLLCKDTFVIKSSSSHSELTFLAGLVIPLLTGKNEAITTSFDIICRNGLRDNVTPTMKEDFFKKMNGENGFMSIIKEGWDRNQFKKSAKGYPNFGPITPIIYLVNQFHDPETSSDAEDMISKMRQFFDKMNEDEDKELEWKIRFRKNRNVEALRNDILFIRNILNDEVLNDEVLNDEVL